MFFTINVASNYIFGVVLILLIIKSQTSNKLSKSHKTSTKYIKNNSTKLFADFNIRHTIGHIPEG